MPFTSKFLFWCAVWIFGSGMFHLLLRTGTAENRLLFAASTLTAAILVWIFENIEWKGGDRDL